MGIEVVGVCDMLGTGIARVIGMIRGGHGVIGSGLSRLAVW